MVCSLRMPPLPETNAVWASATWAGAGAAHQLPGGVADVVHATGVAALTETQLSARGIHREVTAERQVVRSDELHPPCPFRRSRRLPGSAGR